MSFFESPSTALSNLLYTRPQDDPKYKGFKTKIQKEIKTTEQVPWWYGWGSSGDMPVYKLKGKNGQEYWEARSIFATITESGGKKYYNDPFSFGHGSEIVGEYKRKQGTNTYEMETVRYEDVVDPFWEDEPVKEDTDMGKNRGGGGGGGGATTSGITYDQQLKLQRDSQEASAKLMREQVELQNKFALEAELRLKKQQEETRLQEEFRRQRIASDKKQKLQTQEAKESAVFKEMTGQAKFDPSYFTGRVNLDMPTIERPSYEGEGRPS